MAYWYVSTDSDVSSETDRPTVLTKLGYLIDNPWNNALDRARAAGSVLADVLIQRHLGVRPITLIGFSLGARVIFYALLELAKKKAFGIVQDVFLLGTTLSASVKSWCETRSVVSGRYVNAYARNDWLLNYLFRATSGGVGTVAGLRPVENVPGLENVDVTDKISGHMSYRTFMPLILDQLGFPVSADYFDEPEVCFFCFVFVCAMLMSIDSNPTLKASVLLLTRMKPRRRRVGSAETAQLRLHLRRIHQDHQDPLHIPQIRARVQIQSHPQFQRRTMISRLASRLLPPQIRLRHQKPKMQYQFMLALI